MSKDHEEESSRGFKVQDRRRFTDTADATDVAEPEPTAASTPEPPRAASPPPLHDEPALHEGLVGEGVLPELSFSSFVVGLYQQALMHLGEIPDPHGQAGPDLEAARQMIDLLGILRDKTKGNLDSGEAKLLENMLYDLRMRYVEGARAR